MTHEPPLFNFFSREKSFGFPSGELVRVTTSLPRRGMQHAGAGPLDPRPEFLYQRFRSTAMLHGAGLMGCQHRISDADLRRRSLQLASAHGPILNRNTDYSRHFCGANFLFFDRSKSGAMLHTAGPLKEAASVRDSIPVRNEIDARILRNRMILKKSSWTTLLPGKSSCPWGEHPADRIISESATFCPAVDSRTVPAESPGVKNVRITEKNPDLCDHGSQVRDPGRSGPAFIPPASSVLSRPTWYRITLRISRCLRVGGNKGSFSVAWTCRITSSLWVMEKNTVN